MRGLRLRLFAALVAALLVVAGCGNAEQDTAEDAGTVMPKDEAIAAVTERCAQVNETFEEVDFEEEPGGRRAGRVRGRRARHAPAR